MCQRIGIHFENERHARPNNDDREQVAGIDIDQLLLLIQLKNRQGIATSFQADKHQKCCGHCDHPHQAPLLVSGGVSDHDHSDCPKNVGGMQATKMIDHAHTIKGHKENADVGQKAPSAEG